MGTERLYKGNSIIDFPDHFTVIDIETTGFSPTNDKIIEIAAIKVRNNTIADTFSSLIQPNQKISRKIEKLTGITNNMLIDAPDISLVLPKFLDFIGNDTLIGHNVSFDINFLYDNAEKLSLSPLSNDFVDTMRIFRKLHPELEHHRLADLSELFEIDNTGAHRALNDCETTLEGYNCLLREITEKYTNTHKFTKLFNQKNCSTKIPVIENSDVSANYSIEKKFCKYCGKQIDSDCIICPKCGKQVEQLNYINPNVIITNNVSASTTTTPIHVGKAKNKWIALLLCIFTVCGHKFYEGKIGMGIIYLLTVGLFGIGWIVDIILLLLKPNPYYINK